MSDAFSQHDRWYNTINTPSHRVGRRPWAGRCGRRSRRAAPQSANMAMPARPAPDQHARRDGYTSCRKSRPEFASVLGSTSRAKLTWQAGQFLWQLVLHPEALDVLFVTFHEFQCCLVEFLAQPGWRHCDHASIGRIQVRNPPCIERNPCLAVQVQPERPLLVECSRFFLREKLDPKRQRRIRRPRNRSCVSDQSKRRAHREAVADMESPGWRGFSVVGNRISTNAPSEITGRHSASGTANSFSINVDRSA